MNIFKSFTFTWKQIALLKLSVLFVGIAIGAYFSAFFAPYTLFLLIVGILIGLYIFSIWLKK